MLAQLLHQYNGYLYCIMYFQIGFFFSWTLESGMSFSCLSSCLFKSYSDVKPHFKHPCDTVSPLAALIDLLLISYGEDALCHNNWTINNYMIFCALPFLIFCTTYVLGSWVSFDWKLLNGKRLVSQHTFSTILYL